MGQSSTRCEGIYANVPGCSIPDHSDARVTALREGRLRRRQWLVAAVASVAVLAGTAAALASIPHDQRLLLPFSQRHRTFSPQTHILEKDAVEASDGSCGIIEDGLEYHTSRVLGRPHGPLVSEEVCCALCEGTPSCGAWTWGKVKGVVGLSGLCFLKELGEDEKLIRIPRKEVVSGLPSNSTRKHGIVARQRVTKEGLGRFREERGVLINETCAGDLAVAGGKGVSLVVVPGQNAGRVEVLEGSWVVPHLDSKAYFAESCNPKAGPHGMRYSALKLLGMTLRYTADVSGAGCGCKALLSLVSARGLSRYEVNLQEGNQYAWFSRLHAFDDPKGISTGYGGGGADWNGARDWNASDYGPGGRCIDTSLPFDVAVSFRAIGPPRGREISAVEVTLSQFRRPCSLATQIHSDRMEGESVKELSKELAMGMTPVVSYTRSANMLDIDGTGVDGIGPCVVDVPEACPSTVKFYGFSVARVGEPVPGPDTGGPLSALRQDVVEEAVHEMLEVAHMAQLT